MYASDESVGSELKRVRGKKRMEAEVGAPGGVQNNWHVAGVRCGDEGRQVR
jgi:hypothetical protein